MKLRVPDLSLVQRRGRVLERGLLLLMLAVLVVIGVSFVTDFNAIQVSRGEVDRLQGLLRANDQVISAIKDVETGQRGYLLTGDAQELTPYRNAKEALPQLFNELRARATVPDQLERVARLQALVQNKLAESEASVLVRDQTGQKEALGIVQTDQGRNTMDGIRALSDELQEAALAQLVEHVRELDLRSMNARFGVLSGCAALGGLLFFGIGLIQRSNSRRETLISELNAAHKEFQITLSSIGDGVITTDDKGIVTYLNPVASQLTGWNPDDAAGKTIETIFSAENELTHEAVENPIRRVLRDRKVASLSDNTILKRRGGVATPVDDNAAPVYDDRNNLAGVVMVFRDVSERREIEHELRHWQHVFENAGFGMAVLTPGPNVVLQQINPAFSSMHGYHPDELIGQPYSKLIAGELWENKAKILSGLSDSDHLVKETIHLRKDGSRFPALVDYTLVRNPQGALSYCIGYYLDITDRKRVEEDLRQSEERFRVTAESLPQLIWTNRPDGTTEYMNQRWNEETGITLEQGVAEGWLSSLLPADRATCLERWTHSLQTGETFQADCRFKTTGDSSRWYTCRAVPIRDKDGIILRWFGSCTDIHERKLAAEALRVSKEDLQLANEALRRSNTDLEQFAYAASHDLQEPLRMVTIYSQLLKEECASKLGGQERSFLDFAVDGAKRMESLLKDLLAYSRAGSEGRDPQDEESDSEAALNEALANLSALIQENQAQVTRTQMPLVRMPRVHLVQLFQNLVGNALKYRDSAKPPQVHVDAQPHDGTWIFSVKDNGIGIEPQYQAQIFRIFGRLHNHEVPGTGIGLALCKKLVERSGGSIWVESTPGQGSAFYFTVRP